MPTGTTLRHGQSLLCPHCPLKLFPDYICLLFNPSRKRVLNLGTAEIVVRIVLFVGLSCALQVVSSNHGQYSLNASSIFSSTKTNKNVSESVK